MVFRRQNQFSFTAAFRFKLWKQLETSLWEPYLTQQKHQLNRDTQKDISKCTHSTHKKQILKWDYIIYVDRDYSLSIILI